MADPVSLAASIAGLVIIESQLGVVALKLRKVRDNYRDVPTTLERAITEVTILEMHMNSLKRCLEGSRVNQMIVFEHDAIIQLCLDSVRKITHMLDEHERRLKRYERFGRGIVLVKDQEMKDLFDELVRGKNHLISATLLLSE